MKRFTLMLVAALVLAFSATGCFDTSTNADKANENIGKLCERFECQRSILFVNNITDQVLWQVEGKCSLERNGALPRNLEVLCKHGPDDYRRHHLGLADNVSWVSTHQVGLDVSEYRTKITFRPESIVPDLDLVTGDGG